MGMRLRKSGDEDDDVVVVKDAFFVAGPSTFPTNSLPSVLIVAESCIKSTELFRPSSTPPAATSKELLFNSIGEEEDDDGHS